MPFSSRLEPLMARLLSGLLRALEADEREFVSGDLIEAQESPSASVFHVLGLLIRRQLILWAGWRPWLVFTIVGMPVAVLLSQTARQFAGWSAVYSWMLVNNTDANLLKTAGFWQGAVEYTWTIGLFGLALFCCSWTCGRLIAQLSRSTYLSMGILVALTTLLVDIVGMPSHLAHSFPIHRGDKYFPNGPVFSLSFYRVCFPLIIYAITVLLPMFLATIQTKTYVKRSKALNILSICSTVLVIVGLVDQPWLLMELWSWQIVPAHFLHLPSLLLFAPLGPALYFLTGIGMRWFANNRSISTT
jgi:hypothetical protein